MFSAFAVVFLLIALFLFCSNNLFSFSTSIVLGLLGMAGIFWITKKNKICLKDTIHLANKQNEKLEYSAHLLVTEPQNELTIIQKKKVQNVFTGHEYHLPIDLFNIGRQLLFLFSLVIGVISVQYIYRVVNQKNAVPIPYSEVQANQIQAVLERDTTYIQSFSINVTPPPYTGLKSYSSSHDINMVEGASVRWSFEMSGSVQHFFIIFSDGDTVNMTSSYRMKRRFLESDFYQYGFKSESNSFVSDFYSIKVSPDEKPNITISGIEEYVRLDWEEDYKVGFDIQMSDDYGLAEAFISATVAKGSGESVKFREKEYPLSFFSAGQKNYNHSFHFSTKELVMEPGDELYFYIKARDNYPFEERWTKSTTFFVSIKDTTTYEYVNDAGMQVDLMPDFFRSQRQIIIDSEKLLADQSSISQDSFNRASNALGYDQKMLRLKYGQFLGEENESGIAVGNEIENHDHDHDHEEDEGESRRSHEGVSEALTGARELLNQFMHDHDHEEEEGEILASRGTERKKDPSRPTWVEELSHNHDDTEIATFHDISVKSKLKAALSEMWDAELHLRLYDPYQSLPYQYVCLELLQEVKNHARIYVHRIGFDPPTIKESERRLTGEQKEIVTPSVLQEVKLEDEYAIIKRAVNVLANPVDNNESNTLGKAAKSLARIAIRRPEIIPVLTLMQRYIRSTQLDKMSQSTLLRTMLIKILPQELENVNDHSSFTHDLTRSIAKKMSL